jgi:hypothetical protein
MHYGTSTKIAPETVLDRAQEYFGRLGLVLSKREPGLLCMEGLGGYVAFTVCGGKETDVDVVTKEWDAHVKEFLQRIG